MSLTEELVAYLKDGGPLEFPEITEYRLFECEGHLGILYCDPGADYLDDHCDQCRDDILPFGCRGPSEELPKFLTVSVGERKFARIKAGWRDSGGMDLNRVKFIQ